MGTVSRIDVSAESDITVVSGMSRSGKSAYVKYIIASRPVLRVWDPDGEYVEAGITRPVYTRREWTALNNGPHGGRFSYVGPITRDEFNYWALACLHRGNFGALTVVAEETADVTHSGKAPQHWGALVRRGAKRRIAIVALTQTPSESDKTVMKNARRLVCFMQDRDPDIDYMAREMRLPREQIAALKKLEALVLDKHGAGGRTVEHFRHSAATLAASKIRA